MLSIALFPCTFVEGARLVGELVTRLNLQVYTDEILLVDISEKFGIPINYLKKMYATCSTSHNKLTLERERFGNFLKYFLVTQVLSRKQAMLLYGLLASFFGPNLATILKLLVFDTVEERIKRAVKREGCSRQLAEKMVTDHDKKTVNWLNMLNDANPYDHGHFDLVLALEQYDFLELTEEIVRQYRKQEKDLTSELSNVILKDLELTVTAERVLLNEGYKVGVAASGGVIDVQVEVSQHHFHWLADDLTKKAANLNGVKKVRINNMHNTPGTRHTSWRSWDLSGITPCELT